MTWQKGRETLGMFYICQRTNFCLIMFASYYFTDVDIFLLISISHSEDAYLYKISYITSEGLCSKWTCQKLVYSRADKKTNLGINICMPEKGVYSRQASFTSL